MLELVSLCIFILSLSGCYYDTVAHVASEKHDRIDHGAALFWTGKLLEVKRRSVSSKVNFADNRKVLRIEPKGSAGKCDFRFVRSSKSCKQYSSLDLKKAGTASSIFSLKLRGGRSKRGGKRVKAALEEARAHGSNSTAGARFPIGRWANVSRNASSAIRPYTQTGDEFSRTKKKPLSNRQLANQARSRHRQVRNKQKDLEVRNS